ncbi:MAG: hypothetical protein HY434_02825 [Candidatus Liptonbacteria bacterium]|nr:hypothetical protein [Candidatus Liptonbacteria bacterium]
MILISIGNNFNKKIDAQSGDRALNSFAALDLDSRDTLKLIDPTLFSPSFPLALQFFRRRRHYVLREFEAASV